MEKEQQNKGIPYLYNEVSLMAFKDTGDGGIQFIVLANENPHPRKKGSRLKVTHNPEQPSKYILFQVSLTIEKRDILPSHKEDLCVGLEIRRLDYISQILPALSTVEEATRELPEDRQTGYKLAEGELRQILDLVVYVANRRDKSTYNIKYVRAVAENGRTTLWFPTTICPTVKSQKPAAGSCMVKRVSFQDMHRLGVSIDEPWGIPYDEDALPALIVDASGYEVSGKALEEKRHWTVETLEEAGLQGKGTHTERYLLLVLNPFDDPRARCSIRDFDAKLPF